MKLCLLLLLYSIGDFTGMMWTGYHNLFTIASFWGSLALCFALFQVCASMRRNKRNRRVYRRETL